MYTPTYTESQNERTELKGEIDNSIIIIEDFSTSVSIMDISST